MLFTVKAIHEVLRILRKNPYELSSLIVYPMLEMNEISYEFQMDVILTTEYGKERKNK